MENDSKIIAVLIDAENVSPKYIKSILNEISMDGTPAYKRIYGDWTSTDMTGWKKVLLENNLTPIQQFTYTQGKNASDSAMIIDAMDILYSGNCDGFCLVSSDSDFTRLASRLRESRMFVIGMGESKTPMAFKAACDSFKYLDILYKAKESEVDEHEEIIQQSPNKNAEPDKDTLKLALPKTVNKNNITRKTSKKSDETEDTTEVAAFVSLDKIVQRIQRILEHDSDDDGWMSLAQIGDILGRLYVDFDARNYGFTKLHQLIDYTNKFEMHSEKIPGGGKNVMIRNKNNKMD